MSRHRERDTLTIPKKMFAVESVINVQLVSEESVPLLVGVKLQEFDEEEEVERWPFLELVRSLTWRPTSMRPDTFNAVRAVARYCSMPKTVHCKTALGILASIEGSSD